jgi:hypothetical protein
MPIQDVIPTQLSWETDYQHQLARNFVSDAGSAQASISKEITVTQIIILSSFLFKPFQTTL